MTMKHLALFLLVPLAITGLAAPSTLAQEVETRPVIAGEQNPNRIDIFDGQVATDDITTGAIIRENELLGYCLNVADLAVEARGAFLKKELEDIEVKVGVKLDELDEKITELKSWNEKRDTFLASANDSLVKIYQAMRPDAAALQMAQLGPRLSAAIISKLEPRTSGIILNEMTPRDAARITAYLVSTMETPDASN